MNFMQQSHQDKEAIAIRKEVLHKRRLVIRTILQMEALDVYLAKKKENNMLNIFFNRLGEEGIYERSPESGPNASDTDWKL